MTVAELLALPDDDFAQAVLDSEALNCPGCDNSGLARGCADTCALQAALEQRHSTIPERLTGRRAQEYLDHRKAAAQ